jgi:hypothetical protein
MVVKSTATAALFKAARNLSAGDRVNVTLRTVALGPCIVRRIYIMGGVEKVDVWSERRNTIVTAIPSRGDRIEPAPVPVDA